MNIRRMIKKLELADRGTIDALFDVLLERKRELYPQWEFVFLTFLREDPQERARMIRAALRAMEED